MKSDAYPRARTGLLLVDPYNDFISEGGKLWDRVKDVATAVDLISHLRQVVSAARTAGIQIFFVPHRRWKPGMYGTWKHPNASQIGSGKIKLVEEGSWGAEWHPDFIPQAGDVVIQEHWAQSGFANTDLDQQLKQHDIQKIIVIGMIANTCIESTARFGMELGYHVTLVRDATAAFSREAMHAAHAVNGPSFAHAILTTDELIAALPGEAPETSHTGTAA
jgi:nicotinamidase-related amidase